MGNATNIKIGACKMLFGGRDLGHTKGGVTVNYAPEYSDIVADQFGETPVDKALLSEALTVVVPMTESQLANIKVAIPLATEVGATDGRLTVGKNAGARLSSVAEQLVLHPLANADADATDDLVLYKAVVADEVEIAYNNEDQRVIEVTFMALVDTTKADGSWLGHIGDSTD